MKKSLIAVLAFLAVSSHAAVAPPCDQATFEGQTSCNSQIELAVVAPPPIPEAGTLAMMATGLLLLGVFRLVRSRKA